MSVSEKPYSHGLVTGYIIDLIQGAFLGVMAQQTGLVDHPEIGDHPDIYLPGIILHQEKEDAQHGSDPTPLQEPDEIGSHHARQGDKEGNYERGPAAVGDQYNFFSFLKRGAHRVHFNITKIQFLPAI